MKSRVSRDVSGTKFRCALAMVAIHSALAQSPIPPDEAAAARAALIPHTGERTLRCRVEPIVPSPLYTVPEIAAGFTYSLPLAQYGNSRPEHGWSVVAGFSPDGGAENYFSGHIDMPAPGPDTASGNWAYWVGLGTYSVRLAVSDDLGGVCRKEWTITVRKWPESARTWAGVFIPANPPPDFDIRTQIFLSRPKFHPGTAGGVVRVPARKDEPTAGPPAQRITILMDVPADPRGQLEVLDAFEALLARMPAQSVRLVVFSLAEGHEILRQDNFQPASLGQVKAAVVASTGYRAVDVAELQAHPVLGPAELLDTLVQRETREAQRSDAVLFLGIGLGTTVGPAFRLSAELPRSAPPFSYIQLIRAPDPDAVNVIVRAAIPHPGAPASSPSERAPQRRNISFEEQIARNVQLRRNPIPWVVKKLNGKSIAVDVDKEFDQAVEKVWKTLPASRQ